MYVLKMKETIEKVRAYYQRGLKLCSASMSVGADGAHFSFKCRNSYGRG